jgi:hypothetical protein
MATHAKCEPTNGVADASVCVRPVFVYFLSCVEEIPVPKSLEHTLQQATDYLRFGVVPAGLRCTASQGLATDPVCGPAGEIYQRDVFVGLQQAAARHIFGDKAVPRVPVSRPPPYHRSAALAFAATADACEVIARRSVVAVAGHRRRHADRLRYFKIIGLPGVDENTIRNIVNISPEYKKDIEKCIAASTAVLRATQLRWEVHNSPTAADAPSWEQRVRMLSGRIYSFFWAIPKNIKQSERNVALTYAARWVLSICYFDIYARAQRVAESQVGGDASPVEACQLRMKTAWRLFGRELPKRACFDCHLGFVSGRVSLCKTKLLAPAYPVFKAQPASASESSRESSSRRHRP